jgi:pyruvate/2-oxoglutarate dehydrogenase complex dihydrolipoamide acyltransferase (E2) component
VTTEDTTNGATPEIAAFGEVNRGVAAQTDRGLEVTSVPNTDKLSARELYVAASSGGRLRGDHRVPEVGIPGVGRIIDKPWGVHLFNRVCGRPTCGPKAWELPSQERRYRVAV